ncbi:hypothetical protein HU200_060030 [Digitaria exilis]|uniref:Uncharacterized protein n=1 Tax=Digitaria exilis TaxID=1010633 RepID=A0A835AFA6_9POAL|nr:hypothetical protein HU200_060030 [Digitaria exilis]
MEGLAWEWDFYYSQPALRPPSVTKILYDLERRELAKPIFVCLHCATESQTQQAMAGHCRKHVRAGMAKGTVDHVKYYPDHTYSFLCNGRKLKNPHAPIPAQQAIPQPPNQQIYQEPAHRYNRILPYNGSTMVEGSSSSPFGRVMTPNHNVVGRGTTLSVPTVIDLTLRLGPNASSTAENPMQRTAFRF